MAILHLQSTDSPTRQRARTWHEIPRPSLHAGSAVAMWRVPGRPPAGADDRTLVVHSRLLANSHAFFSTSSSLVRCGTAFVATPLSIPVVVPALCFHRSLNIPMHPICRPLPFAPLQSCPKKMQKPVPFPVAFCDLAGACAAIVYGRGMHWTDGERSTGRSLSASFSLLAS